MRITYRVYFIDNNGYHNQKLLEASCVEDIYEYMRNYEITNIEEVW